MKSNLLIRFIVAKVGPFLARHPFVLVFIWLIYFIAPVDLLPEALTGPLGYLDDILALLIGATFYRKIQTQFSPKKEGSSATQTLTPYEILGVKPGASKEEISAAFKRKMAEYHPDKVAHLGQDLQKLAHEKTLQIQDAYQKLKKKN